MTTSTFRVSVPVRLVTEYSVQSDIWGWRLARDFAKYKSSVGAAAEHHLLVETAYGASLRSTVVIYSTVHLQGTPYSQSDARECTEYGVSHECLPHWSTSSTTRPRLHGSWFRFRFPSDPLWADVLE